MQGCGLVASSPTCVPVLCPPPALVGRGVVELDDPAGARPRPVALLAPASWLFLQQKHRHPRVLGDLAGQLVVVGHVASRAIPPGSSQLTLPGYIALLFTAAS